MKAVTDNTSANGHGCVPTIYLIVVDPHDELKGMRKIFEMLYRTSSRIIAK